MRRRLQLAQLTMAIPAIATLLSVTPCVQAATNARITPTTDDSGHKVYVNDVVASSPKQTFRSQQNHLVFWSTTERRWKSVPHANFQAAKSAAAEVDQYLGKPSAEQNSSSRSGFTQQEIDAAHDADRASVEREQSVQPGREHGRGCAEPEAIARKLGRRRSVERRHV